MSRCLSCAYDHMHYACITSSPPTHSLIILFLRQSNLILCFGLEVRGLLGMRLKPYSARGFQAEYKVFQECFHPPPPPPRLDNTTHTTFTYKFREKENGVCVWGGGGGGSSKPTNLRLYLPFSSSNHVRFIVAYLSCWSRCLLPPQSCSH